MDNDERIRRVYYGERCKHNMVFESCATCQEFTYEEDIKFPIEVDKESLTPKTIWLERTVQRKRYRQYRTSNPESTPIVKKKRYRRHTVDSAITSAPLYKRR